MCIRDRFGRNSDFLTAVEPFCDSPMYRLEGAYGFVGATTAWSEMEDGVNEHGLAAGLTFMYPTKIAPGFNAGMLVRYVLERCSTVEEAIEAIRKLPVGSAQAITLADRSGAAAVVECNCESLEAVSYTHLDVYKRQGYSCLTGCPKALRSPGRGKCF